MIPVFPLKELILIICTLIISTNNSFANLLSACQYKTYYKEKATLIASVNRKSEYNNLSDLSFGYNIELAQTLNSKGNYYSGEMVSLIKRIQPNSLRYPGGTTSNYFDWDNEQLDEVSIDKYANEHIAKLRNRIKKTNNNSLPKAKLKTFSKLVSEFGIRPYVVLNMFSSIEEIIKAINKTKTSVNSGIRWELGNELFFKHYTERLSDNGIRWSVDQYISKIRIISKYIKRNYPGDLIGISISDLADWRNPYSTPTGSTTNYRNIWDIKLSAVSELVDAVIIHPYIYTHDDIIDELQELRCLSISEDRDFYKSLWTISNITYLPTKYLNKIESLFGGKKIWITELGLYDDWTHYNIDEKKKQHTWERMLHNVSLYVSWLQQYPKVDTLLTHGLFDGYSWTHAIYPTGSLTSNGLSYYLVKEYLNKVKSIAPISIDTNNVYSGVDRYSELPIEFVTGLFGLTESDKKIAIIINSSQQVVNLELQWKIGVIEEAHYLKNKQISMKTSVVDEIYTRKNVNSHSVHLKPLSISLFYEAK